MNALNNSKERDNKQVSSMNKKAQKPQKDIYNTYQAVCRFLNTNDGATPHYYLGYN